MAKKNKIQNPSKWVGKYVRHMANWMDYQFPLTLNAKATDDYFVCEYTGKLMRICDEAYYGDTFASYEEAVAAGYDECYSYSEEALYQMWVKAHRKGMAA
jgi:hypothetical protein